MDNRRVLLRNHNLVSAIRGLHQKVRPGQEKLARVLATGHTENNLDHFVEKMKLIFLCTY
jgi:hypothetical protein